MAGKQNRWVMMGALVLAGEAIYTLPYLRQAYHHTMLEAMGLTNTELGVLNSMFGLLALVCYFPGGWLADKVSPRKLLVFSLVATGLGGFVFASFPPYPVLLAVHAFWGISTILTFWAALIKATRGWGRPDEQGKAFGILDGGRGLVQGLLGLLAIGVFTQFASKVDGLAGVIVAYSTAAILAGVVVWFIIPESSDRDVGSTSIDMAQVKEVIRMPVVWAHALVIMFAYAAYWGTFDLAGFAMDSFGQSEVFGASLSTFRMWLRPVSAVAAGFLADRISPSRAVTGGFLVLVVAYGALAAMPSGASVLWLLWIDTAVVGIAVFALRGIYFALLEEGNVPLHLTGTAVGIVSVLGYTPDAVMPLLSGWLLDTFPGAAGHQYLYGLLGFGAIFGVVATRAIPALAAREADDACDVLSPAIAPPS